MKPAQRDRELIERGVRATREEAERAFKDAYSEHDEPLIGVMYGLKAIRALDVAAIVDAVIRGIDDPSFKP